MSAPRVSALSSDPLREQHYARLRAAVVDGDIPAEREAWRELHDYDAANELRARLAARAVVVRDERLLLFRYPNHWQRWILPGGGVDPGEHARQGVAREVVEETGRTALEVGDTPLLFLTHINRYPDGAFGVQYSPVYVVAIDDGELSCDYRTPHWMNVSQLAEHRDHVLVDALLRLGVPATPTDSANESPVVWLPDPRD